MLCVLGYPDGRCSSADKEAQVVHLVNTFRAEESGRKKFRRRKKQEVYKDGGHIDVSHQWNHRPEKGPLRTGQQRSLTFRFHNFGKEGLKFAKTTKFRSVPPKKNMKKGFLSIVNGGGDLKADRRL